MKISLQITVNICILLIGFCLGLIAQIQIEKYIYPKETTEEHQISPSPKIEETQEQQAKISREFISLTISQMKNGEKGYVSLLDISIDDNCNCWVRKLARFHPSSFSMGQERQRGDIDRVFHFVPPNDDRRYSNSYWAKISKSDDQLSIEYDGDYKWSSETILDKYYYKVNSFNKK